LEEVFDIVKIGRQRRGAELSRKKRGARWVLEEGQELSPCPSSHLCFFSAIIKHKRITLQ
jgi:hypothetical protein